MIFCRHDYELIDKTIFPSAAEQADITKPHTKTKLSAPPWVFDKKVIYIFKCKKCQKLKKLEAESK